MRHKIQGCDVIRVDRDGVAAIMARAAPPVECGPDMPVAPARGPMLAVTMREVRRTDAGGYASVNAGYLGRRAARVADAFDRMERDAVRAHARAGGEGRFVAPFTVGQIEAGRDYAALVERVAGSGLRCASLEAAGRGDGSGGGVQDAVFRDIEALRGMRRRIGSGLAKEVKRAGARRRAIRDRDLVDLVCVEGLAIGEVLRRFGWAVDAAGRRGLRGALSCALDRMRGYGLWSDAK